MVDKLTHQEVLNLLKESGCNFNTVLLTETAYDAIVHPLSENCNLFSWDEQGATKIVLGFDCYDYAIKIPFEGEGYNVEDYWRFEYAEDSGDGWDYCCAETLIYADAERESVEDAFAKIELIGFIEGHPIYAQPLCEVYEAVEEGASNIPIEFDWSKRAETSKFLAEKDLWDFNTFWLSQAREWYGDTFLERFLIFLADHVRDLHNGNLGYRGLQPVIIDYGGYNE